MLKKKAYIPKTDCVACGWCTKVCPRQAIQVVKGVYSIVDHSLCVGCGKCSIACPGSVIELKEEAL